MGFLGDFYNKNIKLKRQNAPSVVGVSQPLRMQFRFMGVNQFVWNTVTTDDFVENGFLGNGVVFTVQDWKSQKCATARPLVYQKRDEKSYRQYKSFLTNPTKDSFLRARDIQFKALEEISGHEMQNVLDNPNPFMTRFEFEYGLTAYLDLTGDGYIFGARDSIDGTTGKIREMYLPQAQDVAGVMNGYEITKYYLQSNPGTYIDARNVCHLRNFNPTRRIIGQYHKGLSRLHALSPLVDSYRENITAEASIYADKGVRTMVFPKGQMDPNEGSIEQKQSMRDLFNQQLKESSAGGIITSSVEVGSINLGFNPKDLGLVESRQDIKIDICAAYHIPPELFGWGAHSAYENLPTNRKIAITDAVLPEYEKRINKYNQWLTPSYDPDGKQGLVIGYNLDDFNELQPDRNELATWMERVPGLTANQWLEAFGYGAGNDENANKMLISTKFKLLEQIGVESFEGRPGNPFENEDENG
ncbi:phage portal protein [Dyadobacter chenwenxiniae]|uniref:Phage portal protein n=1 Tax=Dyadobacter chenwenxiniae TaxID=2906456 RepID=A0A9X1PF34_9BACT|nr:phage portal protein [Dyadobacter chenwenxiniae]MCF0059957.1 phage portal protein [Dyadobacter chenwenxiniae]UON85696.1 phage portal protein [Dyadobacter chenwenxiniae]